uniref:Prolactin-releasing peptide n=1 Tax=Callorhinchus milii TaxID=7868 RepID=A0A4W3J8D4_CALMI
MYTEELLFPSGNLTRTTNPLCISLALLTSLTLGHSSTGNSTLCFADTDIDSSWYTGRGIRPVGRFGRRGLTLENSRKYDFGTRRICIPIQEREDSSQDE